MNNAIRHSKHPKRNITSQAQPHPAHCGHQHEVLIPMLGDVLKRSAKSASQEAA